MPIKGLTTDVEPQFPRLGKLRKGGPKGSSGFGKDLDHFRFTSDRPEVEAAFKEAYGERPRVLQVYLPHPDALRNFESWREEWAAGGLVHRCDGETCTISRKGNGYTSNPVPCPNIDKDDKDRGCKPVGRLSVILPKLVKAGYVGYVTMETHSKHDLMRITGALRAVGNASVYGIPFELRRYEDEVSTPGQGNQRVRRKKWLVALVPEPTFMEVQLQLARQAAYTGLLGAGKLPELPEPDFIDMEPELDDVPDYDDALESTGPTMDEIGAAMLAVGPSGEPLGKFDRLVWGKVATAKGSKYSTDLKAKAKLLFEHQNLVQQWRAEYGNALDDVMAQDSLADEDVPPEAY